MSRPRNAAQNDSVLIGSKYFENVAHLQNLETTITYQNCIHE